MSARRAVVGVVVLAVGLIAGAAHATDGVIEINQAKALAGGVTPGDGAGFPVTISQAGSYRLTSDLDVSGLGGMIAENTNVILVTSLTGVTIDLNGFSLIGPTVCGVTCSPTGMGAGVAGGSSDQVIVLRNGSIRGMGGYGVSLFVATVENVAFSHNGIQAALIQGGVMRHAIAYKNGKGLEATNAEVSDSHSRDNLGFGIKAKRIVRSMATGNVGNGLEASGPVLDSQSASNTSDELTCDSTCMISGNQFSGCAMGGDCFGGMGTILEAPAGSNVCDGGPCS